MTVAIALEPYVTRALGEGRRKQFDVALTYGAALDQLKFPAPTSITWHGPDIRVSFEGPRHAILLHNIIGFGWVNFWAGKSNDDSGGAGGQASDPEGLRRMAILHKRFLGSGRRGILRRKR